MTSQTLNIKSARKTGWWGIAAYDEQGYAYIPNHRFGRDDPRCTATLEKVRAAGQINLAHWRRARPNEA